MLVKLTPAGKTALAQQATPHWEEVLPEKEVRVHTTRRVDHGIPNPRRGRGATTLISEQKFKRAAHTEIVQNTPVGAARALDGFAPGAYWTQLHEDEMTFQRDKHMDWKLKAYIEGLLLPMAVTPDLPIPRSHARGAVSPHLCGATPSPQKRCSPGGGPKAAGR